MQPELASHLFHQAPGDLEKEPLLPGPSIAIANDLFGPMAWDCHVVAAECVWKSKGADGFLAAYTARVRLTVRSGTSIATREASGCGEARTATPGEAHEKALKRAESDALRRAFATLGQRLGLAMPARRLKPRPAAPLAPPEPPHRSGMAQVAPRATDVAPRPSPSPHGEDGGRAEDGVPARAIDKSALHFSEPKRYRDTAHRRFVATQPCLVCGRQPSQAHHLRFMQPRAMSRKVSDEYTVPLCGLHHSALHQTGDERRWWNERGLDPGAEAERLWAASRDPADRTPRSLPRSEAGAAVADSTPAATLAAGDGGDARGAEEHGRDPGR